MQRSCCKLPRSGSNMPVDASLHRFASVLTLLPFLPELESDPAFANYQETGNPFLPRFGEERYGVVRILPDRTSGTPNGTRPRRPFLLEGIQGVNGAPVLSYPSGEFAVIVSEYDRANHQVDEKTVLEHARVVSVCFRNGTVLPFRFGTVFDSDDALRQAVRSNRRAFGVSVEKLRGKSEMRLKLVVRDGSLKDAMANVELPDTVGREYLAKLREKASKERERQTKARALSVQV